MCSLVHFSIYSEADKTSIKIKMENMEKMELDPVTGEFKGININFYSLFDQNSIGEVIIGDIKSKQNRWVSNGKK